MPIAGGLALLLMPEIVYVRDAFDGSPLDRMNTVFKAGYQAWLFLGAGRRRVRCRGPSPGCRGARCDAAGPRSARCCCSSALVYP